jgi:hypothetical protein
MSAKENHRWTQMHTDKPARLNWKDHSPSPRPTPLGRGRLLAALETGDRSVSLTRASESDSLSLGERVRVRGNSMPNCMATDKDPAEARSSMARNREPRPESVPQNLRLSASICGCIEWLRPSTPILQNGDNTPPANPSN